MAAFAGAVTVPSVPFNRLRIAALAENVGLCIPYCLNGRFAPILLKKSKIEPHRKSRKS
jgi:hypothetical protein